MERHIISINMVISDPKANDELNALFSEYRDYVIGRMGIPYHSRGISIITAVLDAPDDVANALSGRLGLIEGVECKTVRAKAPAGEE